MGQTGRGGPGKGREGGGCAKEDRAGGFGRGPLGRGMGGRCRAPDSRGGEFLCQAQTVQNELIKPAPRSPGGDLPCLNDDVDGTTQEVGAAGEARRREGKKRGGGRGGVPRGTRGGRERPPQPPNMLEGVRRTFWLIFNGSRRPRPRRGSEPGTFPPKGATKSCEFN